MLLRYRFISKWIIIVRSEASGEIEVRKVIGVDIGVYLGRIEGWE